MDCQFLVATLFLWEIVQFAFHLRRTSRSSGNGPACMHAHVPSGLIYSAPETMLAAMRLLQVVDISIVWRGVAEVLNYGCEACAIDKMMGGVAIPALTGLAEAC